MPPGEPRPPPGARIPVLGAVMPPAAVPGRSAAAARMPHTEGRAGASLMGRHRDAAARGMPAHLVVSSPDGGTRRAAAAVSVARQAAVVMAVVPRDTAVSSPDGGTRRAAAAVRAAAASSRCRAADSRGMACGDVGHMSGCMRSSCSRSVAQPQPPSAGRFGADPLALGAPQSARQALTD